MTPIASTLGYEARVSTWVEDSVEILVDESGARFRCAVERHFAYVISGQFTGCLDESTCIVDQILEL
jgi:hypothetical protein